MFGVESDSLITKPSPCNFDLNQNYMLLLFYLRNENQNMSYSLSKSTFSSLTFVAFGLFLALELGTWKMVFEELCEHLNMVSLNYIIIHVLPIF